MQELIDLMKSHESRGWGNMTFDFFFAQLDEIKALEKEKEQIIDAYRIASINNASNEDMKNIKAEYWQINAELWYDKHYNQNK
jgi:hypothetical protein